jgi:Do/DeqQ family serine protease
MNSRQFILGILIGAVASSLTILFTLPLIFDVNKSNLTLEERQQISLVNNRELNGAGVVPAGLNFIDAANKVTPAVVHIKASSTGRNTSSMLEQIFGIPETESRRGERSRKGPFATQGSGVILTEDGYIVTNYHVINMAERLEVTLLDNRTYRAKIIGADAQTDLALIKINARNLPFVPFGDSDEVNIGEWVLAVGNPFELNSTVTAGIVSAKGRNIDILKESNLSVESFIQTDAVVNPGNSGGALVDLNGNLIGINTAIATRTGSFSGYSFAVPVSLVSKVVEDLREFGLVQRAILGVAIRELNADLAREKRLPIVQGVLIEQVNPGSGAFDAGLQRNDVIVAINDRSTPTVSTLQETVARHRPGTKLRVKFYRGAEPQELMITLKSADGTTTPRRLLLPDDAVLQDIELINLSEAQLETLGIQNGIKIVSLNNRKWMESGIKAGFIITHLGNRRINSIEVLENLLSDYEEGREVILIGQYEDGLKSFYTFYW